MAFWTFTPPNTTKLSTWEMYAPTLANRLMGHFQANLAVNNVWIYSDNTVSENQPPYLEQNPSDSTGAYAVRVFYGGHTYTDVTDSEKALLQGAGYTVT
jgi:hypothetical protein